MVLDLAPLLARARDAHVPGHVSAGAASQQPTATSQQLAGKQPTQPLEASAANGAIGGGSGKAAASVAVGVAQGVAQGGANGEGPPQQNGVGQSTSDAGKACLGQQQQQQQHQRSALAAAVQAAAAEAGQQGQVQGQAAVPPCEYELVGVVEHSGQLRFGHYVSTVRCWTHSSMCDIALLRRQRMCIDLPRTFGVCAHLAFVLRGLLLGC